MTVLLAYIDSPEGDAALDVAIGEARQRATDAVVVNVTQPGGGGDSPVSAEQGLDAVAARFQAAGVEVDVRQLPAGTDRAGDILAVVEELEPELVVIGMRPRTPVGKLVMGSTLTRLLRGVACPLLVVKAPGA
jgi:nucleotide-binding universal stress UspA family protein